MTDYTLTFDREFKNLTLLSTAAILLYLLRVVVTGRFFYGFMLWNLFLAIIPYGVCLWFRFRESVNIFYSRLPILHLLLLISVWMAFLPNAPYMVTDLVHVIYSKGVLLIYDITMILTFAATGLYLYCSSAYYMGIILVHRYSRLDRKWWHLFQAVLIAASSIGVYVGRVLRWNSWDLVTRPVDLVQEFLGIFTNYYLFDVFIILVPVLCIVLSSCFYTYCYFETRVKKNITKDLKHI